jgi:hypothetical protein
MVMSQQEQDAALLRVVKDRAEAKRQRSLLQSELTRRIEPLMSVTTALRQAAVAEPEYLAGAADKLEDIEPARVVEMLRQLAELTRHIREYDRTAKELGID